MDGYKFRLEDGSWLLIRFSGTEPVLRLYCESSTLDLVDGKFSHGQNLGLPISRILPGRYDNQLKYRHQHFCQSLADNFKPYGHSQAPLGILVFADEPGYVVDRDDCNRW
jgi:hypothetical protein